MIDVLTLSQSDIGRRVFVPVKVQGLHRQIDALIVGRLVSVDPPEVRYSCNGAEFRAQVASCLWEPPDGALVVGLS